MFSITAMRNSPCSSFFESFTFSPFFFTTQRTDNLVNTRNSRVAHVAGRGGVQNMLHAIHIMITGKHTKLASTHVAFTQSSGFQPSSRDTAFRFDGRYARQKITICCLKKLPFHSYVRKVTIRTPEKLPFHSYA